MKKLLSIFLFIALFSFALNAQQVVYNFNDGSWGEPATERPESGTYSSSNINGVKLSNAVLYQKDGKGTTRIILDKRSTKSNIEFPEFSDAKSVIIEASVGTEDKTLGLEQKVNNKWVSVGEPVTLTKQKASYSFTLSEDAKQIRIVNPTTSALYIYKVTIK